MPANCVFFFKKHINRWKWLWMWWLDKIMTFYIEKGQICKRIIFLFYFLSCWIYGILWGYMQPVNNHLCAKINHYLNQQLADPEWFRSEKKGIGREHSLMGKMMQKEKEKMWGRKLMRKRESWQKRKSKHEIHYTLKIILVTMMKLWKV